MLDKRRLLTVTPPWIHLLAEMPEDRSPFLWPLHDASDVALEFRTVRGYLMREQDGLFAEISAAWQFPGYFGWNWNAFNECINDLDWLAWFEGLHRVRSHPDVFVMQVSHADELLVDEYKAAFNAFVRMLHDTGEEWAHRTEYQDAIHAQLRPRGFHSIFQVAPGQREVMLKRLGEARQEYPHVVFDEIVSNPSGSDQP
jgi:hypothetical protein